MTFLIELKEMELPVSQCGGKMCVAHAPVTYSIIPFKNTPHNCPVCIILFYKVQLFEPEDEQARENQQQDVNSKSHSEYERLC